MRGLLILRRALFNFRLSKPKPVLDICVAHYKKMLHGYNWDVLFLLDRIYHQVIPRSLFRSRNLLPHFLLYLELLEKDGYAPCWHSAGRQFAKRGRQAGCISWCLQGLSVYWYWGVSFYIYCRIKRRTDLNISGKDYESIKHCIKYFRCIITKNLQFTEI